jgi:hypothetical protein
MSPSLALKKETVCLSGMLVSTYESTRRQNPEEQHRHATVLVWTKFQIQ